MAPERTITFFQSPTTSKEWLARLVSDTVTEHATDAEYHEEFQLFPGQTSARYRLQATGTALVAHV